MKRKRQYNIKPETLAFLENEGPVILSQFMHRYNGGKFSRRGNNYETVKDYSFRNVQSRFDESIRD